MKIAKREIIKAAGSLQPCASQEASSEAVMHAVHLIFEANETEVILISEVENAYSTINRKVLPSNIEYMCSVISTYL